MLVRVGTAAQDEPGPDEGEIRGGRVASEPPRTRPQGDGYGRAREGSAMPATHEVFNQVPPRADVDELATHPALVAAVRRYGAAWAEPALADAGRLVGGAAFQEDAELANRNPPMPATHARWGHRVDAAALAPSSPRVTRAAHP